MATAFKLVVDNDSPAPVETTVPGRQFWSAQELADAKLPGLSSSKRKINERARAENWAFRLGNDGSPLARTRSGRGGGIEYHVDVLPPSARLALIKSKSVPSEDGAVAQSHQIENAPNVSSLWHWLERQSAKVKAEAQRRLAAIDAVAVFEAAGMTRSAAVASVSAQHDASPATLWNWLSLVAGCPLADRLPHLAPRRQGGGKEADVDPEIWTSLISNYLRPEKPTWETCYWMARRTAEARGIVLPHSRTLLRKLEREIDPRLIIMRRDGLDALRTTLPYQQRTVADLQALELVNIDGHRWDVFVKLPDDRVIRPMMVAIQDVFSRKILAYRIGETESAVLTRLAFADLFKNHGIPGACLLDNGRAFASKWITGGSLNRFRFKVRDEEPTGILTSLGIGIHWAKPYRGSSKPIERAFRDLCDSVAKHPAFAGAYTGNSPLAKPENYASRAVAFDLFERIVASGIAAHNAKEGRRTETSHGRSFDAVYAESYATAPIRKANEEQLRLALLAADEVRTERKSGAISLYGNRYWCEELAQVAGQRVTVRFDPDHLHDQVHVYSQADEYLCAAPVWEATGFLDAGAAKDRARQESQLKKAIKRKEEIEELIDAAEIARMLPDDAPADLPEAHVVRPVRHRGRTAAALKDAPQRASRADLEQRNNGLADRMSAIAERHLRAVE